ncbi:hypothetical protein B1218_35440, partial [Pseudomonas ogarae]
IASTLNNHTDIARELTRFSKTRIYLARQRSGEDPEDKHLPREQTILSPLRSRHVLNEALTLRRPSHLLTPIILPYSLYPLPIDNVFDILFGAVCIV